jgi:hypothetical protein
MKTLRRDKEKQDYFNAADSKMDITLDRRCSSRGG